jgi:RNase P/RNase MRP subunit p29
MSGRLARALPALAALLGACGCGYHVAGKAGLMPKTVKTIAIPAFTNNTTRYKLAQRLPADITREFITRTRYRIVADPKEADAVLTGAIVNFYSYPIITDQASGRATAVQASAFLTITLTDRATGKVLFSRPSFEARERYEISVDPQAYFDESGAGMDRLARDVARDVVTSILENF